VLRAWEMRYGVVSPSRTEGGQRLYSDADVLRLSLLHRVVEEGRNISQVAPMSTAELQVLAREDESGRTGFDPPKPLAGTSAAGILTDARRAVDELNPGGLERILTRAALAFSVSTITDDIVGPLLREIGAAWEDGLAGPGQEHLATVVIRRFLEWMLQRVNAEEGAPVLVAGTASGEKHELGALLSAVSGAEAGWRSVFIGPDLPAEEIASVAVRLGAAVVAVSCVDPRTAQSLPGEIHAIRMRLPDGVRLVLGGPLPIAAEIAASETGVEFLGTLRELRAGLRSVRLAR
jgi:DNA-binding transcriptional MerR regulator/methanogenic corrinoid protein MtbC1